MTGGRWLGLSVAVVVTLGAVVGVLEMTGPTPYGTLAGQHALADGGAIVTVRSPSGGGWVARLGPNGDVMWKRHLAATPSSVAHRDGLSAAGLVVSVRAYDAAGAVTIGVTLAEGRVLWERRIFEGDPEAARRGMSATWGDARHVVEYVDAGPGNQQLVAIDRYNGGAWTHGFAEAAPARGVLLSHRFVVSTARGLVDVLSRADGERVGRYESHGNPCLVGETLHVPTRSGIRAVDLAGQEPRAQAEVAIDDGEVVSCGGFDLLLVALVQRTGGDSLVAWAADGTNAWTLDLEGHVPRGAFQQHAMEALEPASAPVGGALSRTLVLAVGASRGPVDERLMVIDLAEHRVAWRSAPAPGVLRAATVFRANGRHYVATPTGLVMVDTDGAEGVVVRAVTLPNGVLRVAPQQVRGGRVWVRALAQRGIDDGAWAALSGETLLVEAMGDPSTLSMHDATSSVRAQLGLE